MQVICAQCGTSYELGPEYSGKRVKCRTCQAVIEVPAMDAAAAPGAQAGPGTQPGAYGAPSAMAGGQAPYGADRAAAFETHRKMVGIFNIVVGILSLLWAAFCAIFVVTFMAMPQREFGRDGPPKELMVAMYGAMLVLSLIAGIIQLVAGTKVLKGSPGARSMGLFSGFLSCASLWGCCVYLFCLASGIYTLIILFGQDARDFLEKRGGPV